MKSVVFRRAKVFDGWNHEVTDECDVLVADGLIQEISTQPLPTLDEVVAVDCRGLVLMPGLIDAHVHVYASSVNLAKSARQPATYLAHFAATFLRSCLDRGFTTIRDVGGADVGLALALKENLVEGPRLFYGGRVLSQTGGHGDFRPVDHDLEAHCHGCACGSDALATVVDGVDEMRRAVREEIRRGASHIKIMGSGGVSSPSDPLDRCQFSENEISAAVDEADRAGKYVAAHCHPAEAVRRCVTLGVRSIEHATLIDRDTAGFVAERGAYVVPTMAIIFGLLEQGERLGFPRVSMEKLRRITDHALTSLDILRRAGVKMGFGTDLLGELCTRQSSEFELRARVLPIVDILRSACAVNAELLGEVGRLGCVRPGALADLLVVDGDPTKDISVLAGESDRLRVIMKGGRFHKRMI
jgi:imidazolonepropionase-like amidohydrolase